MPSRRYRGLQHGSKRGQDGVVYHREHRSKKGRKRKDPQWGGTYDHKERKRKLRDKEHTREIGKYFKKHIKRR